MKYNDLENHFLPIVISAPWGSLLNYIPLSFKLEPPLF